MENSRPCESCNVNVHRATMQKLLGSEKHVENLKQNEMIIPEWLFKQEQTPIRKKIQKVYNPKRLKQIARENGKMNAKELDKEKAKKMINPYYFTDENLKIDFKINLESHNFIHANPLFKNTSNFPEFEIEFKFIMKTIKKIVCYLF